MWVGCVREILSHLSPKSTVLDLGCDQGSFDESAFPDIVCLRVDLEIPRERPRRFVQADASRVPFRSHAFDAIICNHSLEHFLELDSVLLEIGRLLKPGGAFFASIPDASQAVHGRGFFQRYACPCCGATNLFTQDHAVRNIC
jgi:2-polyprenyl-3-methyl-5-hydroxy-6-metoxy-1,4-benzoquinol methylase